VAKFGPDAREDALEINQKTVTEQYSFSKLLGNCLRTCDSSAHVMRRN
jgi:NADH:ubiquinone oxidoreductase subunit E